MKVGSDQHEIRRCLADLGAGDHEPEMLRLDMLATCLKAMVHGHAEASAVAAQAFVDAALHFRGHLVHFQFSSSRRRRD
ncbi:hypothetical protein [Paracoccus solventivorans]|uniref:hypothetical protein n=1 Tax=Paracoccus solventivorans TaxID=53463 RepID=UPI00190EDD7F|nr:hypothetical protein [Paracoccus solventivorans]